MKEGERKVSKGRKKGGKLSNYAPSQEEKRNAEIGGRGGGKKKKRGERKYQIKKNKG